MNCPIEGVVIRALRLYTDERGWLTELFRHDELPPDLRPVMSYLSMTRPGAARGPHEHRAQTDCFCFPGPSTFRLYLWDNRTGSRTYRNAFRVDLGEALPAMVIVPPGVIHGYRNIGNADGPVFNAPNRLYAGEGRKLAVDEIRYEDAPESPYQISD